MDLRLLRSFVAVAEELHFGRAARRLGLSQPPLSVQIRRLEEELGARLFERDRRHVALTDAGQLLLGRARHLLGEAERARVEVARAARGEGGTLTIGYTPTATYEVLPSLIPALRAASPELVVVLREMRSPEQPDAVRERRIDLGIACGPVGARDLDERVLVREPLWAALPSRWPLAKRARVDVGALGRVPIVLVRRDVEPAWADASAAAVAHAGVRLDVVAEADTKIALLGLVAAGVGASLSSRSMSCLGRRGVTFRPLGGLPSLTLPLVALHARAPSPRIEAALKLLREAAAKPARR
jgi:DNA-binding transcriptional LysR family regulator